MVFGLFKTKSDVLKEKIIYTQKNRIGVLENELEAVKAQLAAKDDRHHEVRSNFERSKERLVEQVIDLSDKFAEINQRMMDLAQENAKLKYEPTKVLESKPKKTRKKK